MTQRTCEADGCERKHLARGLCSMHWKRANPRKADKPVECPTCGVITMKREATRADVKKATGFCSLTCRDAWRCDQPDDPMWSSSPRSKSDLPTEHPVRVLMRERSQAPGPMRQAFIAGDWSAMLAQIEARAVVVDQCWLWPRVDRTGYGRIAIAGRTYGAHRLSASAALGQMIPSHQPVHHMCAEPTCVNPDHLQVVTPEQNVAEMLERRYYQRRIADLESALRNVCPTHPLLANGDASAA